MAFDTFDVRLQTIARKALSFCRSEFGSRGLKTEKEIAPEISWTPSFFFKSARYRIVAVEVADILYTEALKIAAFSILQFHGSPISVYQVCSLQTYQSDPKQAKIAQLLKHGFGIITVDEDGNVRVQRRCVPLSQHISEEDLKAELAGLNPELRVKFKEAHATYLSNEGQGLQQAGQIVEGMISSIATQAASRNVISNAQATGDLADRIDALYATSAFQNYRAALGGARKFVKEFRNIASHAPRSALEAAEKIKKCKTGFLEGISIATKLRIAAKALGYTVRVHTT
jgi:hypothetical protein